MAATQALAEASGGEVVFEGQPWNSNTVDLIRLARAHCLLVLHSTFADSVAQLAAQVAPKWPANTLVHNTTPTCLLWHLASLEYNVRIMPKESFSSFLGRQLLQGICHRKALSAKVPDGGCDACRALWTLQQSRRSQSC